MAAGSIIIDLIMKTGSFETDTKRAEKRLRELEAATKQVGAAFGVAFAGAATATALLVKSSIDAADAASKQAQAAGLSVEAYTALAFAADLAGQGQEEFTASMVKLARSAADADAGVEKSAEAFKRLGVSVRDSSGALKGGDVLLEDLAEAFAGLRPGIDKTALATDVFGKSGARMLPLLNAGKAGIQELKLEAQALGVVFSTQTAIGAEQFNDNLSRLSQLAKGFGNDLAAGLLPYLVDTTTMLVDLGKESRTAGDNMEAVEPIADGLAKTVKSLAFEAAQTVYAFRSLGYQMAEFGAKATIVRDLLNNASGNPFKSLQVFPDQWRAISEAVNEDLARAEKQLDRFTQRVATIGTNAKLGGMLGLQSSFLNPSRPETAPIGGRGGSSAAKAGAAPKVSEAERYLESLQKQLQGTKDLSVAEAVLADLQSGRLGKVNDAQKTALLGVAEQIDMAKRRDDQLKAEDQQLQDLKASYDALRDAGRAVYESTRTPAEKLGIELDRLNKLLQHGAVDWDTYSRAVFAAQYAFDATSVAQKKTATELDEFAKNAAENLQRSFGDVLVNAMNGNFKNIGDSFKQMVDRMVAEAAAAKIVRELFGQGDAQGALGALGKSLGYGSAASAGGGSTLATMFGSSGGGADLASFAMAFAGGLSRGGDVMPERSYLVGENGPERFVPRTFGTILPNTGDAAAGHGKDQRPVVVHQAITVSGTPTRETALQFATATSRKLHAAARNM